MYQQPMMQPMPGQPFIAQQPQMQMRGGYGGYGAQAYGQPGFAGPAMYQGGFGQPGGFGRGGGGFRGGMGGGMGGGFGNRGGFGGFRGRGRKKPFVGGSLETQREWERANLCCFHLQGNCKFGDRCRFSHEDDGGRRCHFGLSCRVGHQNRGQEGEQKQDTQMQPQQ